MLEVLWSIAAFVVTLGILVTIHEFGHFWVARRCGVKILTFSVGFGKPIWQRQGADGTQYQVSWIPLGGYVRMLDSRVDEVSAADYPQSFNAKSVGQRAAIVAAGPIANFLLAMMVLWWMFWLGVQSVKPIIGVVTPDSIAAQAELPEQAEIIAVDGRVTEDWQQVNLALAAAVGQPQTELLIRDARQRERVVLLNTTAWRLTEQQQPTFVQLGIQPYRPKVSNEIAAVADDSPAAAAGLQIGDKIIAVNGTLTNDWSPIREVILAQPEAEVVLTIERAGQQFAQSIQLGAQQTEQGWVGYLGVAARAEAYPEAYLFEQRYGLLESLQKGAERTWELMVLSVKMIGKLLTGVVSVSNLSGPVAIAEGAGVSASYGLVYFLGFLALISVNLGIINLLPLPILDGGHLVFLGIEAVRKRAVSERVQEVCYRIGGLLIFALMAIALTNDMLRLTQ